MGVWLPDISGPKKIPGGYPEGRQLRQPGSLLGDVAQLARALAWHARGQGFESPYLHAKRS